MSDGSTAVREAVDYVRPDFLDAYVADARLHWQAVEVSEEPDAGPLGYDGPTYVPPHLPVSNAGQFYPPTPGSAVEVALAATEAAALAAEGGRG